LGKNVWGGAFGDGTFGDGTFGDGTFGDSHKVKIARKRSKINGVKLCRMVFSLVVVLKDTFGVARLIRAML